MQESQFQEEFTGLRSSLVSYLFRLTAHRADAEDLAQETYLRARRGLSQFAGRSRFKTWVFAIATNLARDQFRVQTRWREDSQDACRERTQASPGRVAQMVQIRIGTPVEQYDLVEHVSYCFTCMGKTLEIEEQLAVILKEIYRFTLREMMEILGLSEGRVKHALARGRSRLTDIFERRCALLNKTGVCHQCSELSGFVNPKQSRRESQLRRKWTEEGGRGREHLFELRTELIRNVHPLEAAGSALHAYLLELVAEHPRS